MAAALRLTGGAEVEQTANFVEMMDRFFDCMNVKMFTTGKHKRNPFKDPFRPNDFRIKVYHPSLKFHYAYNEILFYESGWKMNSCPTWISGSKVLWSGRDLVRHNRTRCS